MTLGAPMSSSRPLAKSQLPLGGHCYRILGNTRLPSVIPSLYSPQGLTHPLSPLGGLDDACRVSPTLPEAKVVWLIRTNLNWFMHSTNPSAVAIGGETRCCARLSGRETSGPTHVIASRRQHPVVGFRYSPQVSLLFRLYLKAPRQVPLGPHKRLVVERSPAR